MSFLSLSIRSRLYCGFGAIVFIALGLSLFSGWRLLTLQSDVGTMVHFSQASVRAHEVTENLQVMRRAVLRYMYDGDEASFKESTANEAKAIELLQAAIPAVLVEERRAIYQGLEKSVREFRAQREVLGGFITLKLADREALFSAGDELTSMTQKLVQTAHENGEPPMVQAAANVETALLLVRVANLRFMTSNDPKWIATFSTNANNTSQQLAAMRKAAPQELSAMAAAIEASFSKYAATFSKMSTNTVKAEDLYEKEMKPLIVASIAKIDELVAGQKRDLLRNQAQTEASIAITITIQAIAAALTALLGGLAAFFISRGISNPVKTMVSAMKALAGGNLKVEIPAQDKKDEIGEMAQAVLVFRDAAVENARLEEEAAGQRMGAEGERSRNEQAQREAIAQERAIVASSIGAALAKLAAKDLTYRMPADIPEAYRKLQTDFNEAIAQLEVAMQSVTGSTDAIQSGTQEISTASDDLSRRTEQQAASLEETAAALDEITATVKKSAEGATHARQVVAAADDDAKKSAVVVREAVAAMDAIAKSSQQVSQIIGVIDEIAFQTNLLALNAGVEAARAGDAGRGFAVVASEVRALAQRSAEAAKEIKGLISASSIQVTNGVKLVAETGKSLERIMVQVTEINEVVTGIAAGAKEQAMGLAEVNTAINQMDQVTQQNAAMVEQSTAASHSLSQETAQLAGLIGQFRVGGATGSDASMRQQLQKVAPHAFRQPVKAPGTKAEAKPVRTLKAKAAHGADANNWDEF